MDRNPNPSDQEIEAFERIYDFSLTLSMEKGINTQEIFNLALEAYFTDGKINKDKILKTLFPEHITDPSTSTRLLKFPDVWLIFGETGMGKSTLVNTFCGDDVTIEGHSHGSQTVDVEMFESKEKIVMIDTPGFFDTRAKIKDSDILMKIIQKVEEKLKFSAKIDALVLIWNPTAANKFRFSQLEEKIIKAFGQEALRSLFLLINKETKNWKPKHDKLVEGFLKDMKNSKIPYMIYDVKDYENIGQLKTEVSKVAPYRDDYFSLIRKEHCFQQFQMRELQSKLFKNKVDEAAKPIVDEMKKKMEEQEKDFRSRIQKMEKETRENDQRHQRDLDYFKNKLSEMERNSVAEAERHRVLVEELKKANENTVKQLRSEVQTTRRDSSPIRSRPQLSNHEMLFIIWMIQQQQRQRYFFRPPQFLI